MGNKMAPVKGLTVNGLTFEPNSECQILLKASHKNLIIYHQNILDFTMLFLCICNFYGFV